jgi:hypothetical protein
MVNKGSYFLLHSQFTLKIFLLLCIQCDLEEKPFGYYKN